jgi:hypothetical protein
MTPPPIPPVIDASRRNAIRYTITRWDILCWNFSVLIRNRVLIGFFIIVSFAVAANDLRGPEMSTRSISFKIFYAVFFTVTMSSFVAAVTLALTSCVVLFKKNRGFLGDHELEIRDEGLFERTEVNESLHRWAGFHKIVTTRRHLYIFVTDNNVHVVPRRYFASPQEERAFRDELERHIKAACGFTP